MEQGGAEPIILYGLVHFPRIGFIESLDPATKEQIHSIFSAAHLYLGYALYVMLALHLLGVVKHHIFDRERSCSACCPGGDLPFSPCGRRKFLPIPERLEPVQNLQRLAGRHRVDIDRCQRLS